MKLKFNINSNVVKSKNNLEIARKYHHYDNVESIHVTANEDVYHIDAVVSVFNHPQKCSLDIKDNQVISYECSCPFNDQDSMCGHLGAVILKLNELEINEFPFDYQTIKQIDEKVKEYCVPLGIEKHLLRWGVNEKKIHVMNWWDEVKVDGLTITSTPGRHFTGRVPWRNNTTLWSGYVFKNDKYTTYFTGDTGYGNHFEEVYEKFGAIDLLMIEDGQYDRAWSNIHMLPKAGIQAMKDLHAKWTVPVHWGAFCICNHAWDDPIKQITTRSQKENLNVATPKIGEIVDYSHIETYQEHWWENVE